MPTIRVRVLAILRASYEPRTCIDLAGRLDCQPNTASRVLARLAREGLATNLEGPGRPAAWVAL